MDLENENQTNGVENETQTTTGSDTQTTTGSEETTTTNETQTGNRDYDIQLEAIYVDGKATEIFPKKDSGVDFQKIVCSNDADASFDTTNWSITIGNLTSASSCKIYFNGSIGESTINPPTGAFINILLIGSLIAFSVFVIKKIVRKNKFFKI